VVLGAVVPLVVVLEETQVLYTREDHRPVKAKMAIVLKLEMTIVWIVAVVVFVVRNAPPLLAAAARIECQRRHNPKED
jgi:hypothetical protein